MIHDWHDGTIHDRTIEIFKATEDPEKVVIRSCESVRMVFRAVKLKFARFPLRCGAY